MIREMTIEDLEQVVELEKEIFSMPWTRDGFIDALKMSNNYYVVYEEEGRILGYCGYYGVLDEGEITNVAVSTEERNRGVAGKMVAALLENAWRQGIQSVVLEVRLSNAPAIHVYRKLGFEELGIRKNFYEQPVEDALIMECRQNVEK